MKKSIALVLAVLMAGSMLLGSCGKKETKDEDGLASKIVLATGGNTGTYYAYGMAMGKILQDKTGIKFDVQSTGASKANIQLIQSGEADMAVVQNDVMYYAYTGTDLFEAPKPRISRPLQRFIRSFARSLPPRKAAFSRLQTLPASAYRSATLAAALNSTPSRSLPLTVSISTTTLSSRTSVSARRLTL